MCERESDLSFVFSSFLWSTIVSLFFLLSLCVYHKHIWRGPGCINLALKLQLAWSHDLIGHIIQLLRTIIMFCILCLSLSFFLSYYWGHLFHFALFISPIVCLQSSIFMFWNRRYLLIVNGFFSMHLLRFYSVDIFIPE